MTRHESVGLASSRLLCPQCHKQQKLVRGLDQPPLKSTNRERQGPEATRQKQPREPCLQPITSSPGKQGQDSPEWGTRGALLASIAIQLALECQARWTLASKDTDLETVRSSRFQELQAQEPL